MNKNVIEALKMYDFSFEKNKGYGHINDYEVNINPGQYGLGFYFSTFLSQTKKNEFVMKFNALKISLCQAFSFDLGVVVNIGIMSYGGFGKKFNEVLPKVLELLSELEAPGQQYCPQSGVELTDENSSLITLSGLMKNKIRLTNDAVELLNSSIKKANEDFDAAPNNYGKGFVGILIGAVAGAFLTIVFELFGFVTWISPLVSIFLGIYLYKKFGGKQNKIMVLMSFLTTIAIILITLFIAFVVICSNACAEAGLTFRGFDAFKFLLDSSKEFRIAVISDFVVNIIIIFIAECASIANILKQIKRTKSL